ncbi:protein maelstrom homolog [Aethina tumida]|uniref:protein maelstrom homolog n=1 Tax=Aethina tumida TaxID=116153 RepID=UPI00096B1681|nr:protein maelstrom homolog [Aethina tumida]
MAPKKNKKKNAFFFFMQEIKQKGGLNNLEAQEIAGGKWSRMSAEERQPYEVIANQHRNNVQLKKYTSDGVDIELIEKLEREELAAITAMQTYIHDDILASQKANVIHKKNFFIIHINTFCYRDTEDKYYPAEIALLQFNLRDGVHEKNIFHRMVHPGTLPLGFTAAATLHSSTSHKIKPPPSYASPNTINNMEQVFKELCKFVKEHMDKNATYPIVYVKEKYMTLVKKVLNMWADDYNNNCYFEVYNLQFMFNELRSAIEQSDIVMANSFGFAEMSKDIYSHVPDIGCEFHESIEYTLHCSKSIVTRQAYIICDNCCPVLKLELIPGRHIPRRTRLNFNEETFDQGGSSRDQSVRTDGQSVQFTTDSEWDAESVASQYSVASSSLRRSNVANDWQSVKRNKGKSYCGVASGTGKKNPVMSSMLNNMQQLDINSGSTMYSDRSNNSEDNKENDKSFPPLGSRGKRN